MTDPNIPKNYTSVYNKEFYENAINENTKKIEKILGDMKELEEKANKIKQ